MADVFKVVVYDIEISALFDAMGEVGKPMTRLQREVFMEAIAMAPARSGAIKRGHVNRGARKAGPYRIRGHIENHADHAEYVHEGTSGPIFPTGGAAEFRLPPGGGYGWRRAESVSGQRANPWMMRAARTVLSRNGL